MADKKPNKLEYNLDGSMKLNNTWDNMGSSQQIQFEIPQFNQMLITPNQGDTNFVQDPSKVSNYVDAPNTQKRITSTSYNPYEGLVNLFDFGLNALASANQKNQQQQSFKPEQPDTAYYNKRMLRGDNQMFAKNGGEYKEGGEFEVDDNELENLRAQGYEFDIMEDGGEPQDVKPKVFTDLNEYNKAKQAYNDSTDLYNYTILQKKLEKQSNFVPTGFMDLLTTGRSVKLNEEGEKAKNILNKEAKRILVNNKNLRKGLVGQPVPTDEMYGEEGSYDINSPKIKPIGTWKGTALNNDYSNVKPVQPVVYQNSQQRHLITAKDWQDINTNNYGDEEIKVRNADTNKYDIYRIGNKFELVPKNPVQPVVYQKPKQKVVPYSKNVGRDNPTDDYVKKHPPIYVTDKSDSRIGSYHENGSQYLYKSTTPVKPKVEDTKYVETYDKLKKLVDPNNESNLETFIASNGKMALRQKKETPITPVVPQQETITTPKTPIGTINIEGKTVPYHSEEELKTFAPYKPTQVGTSKDYTISRFESPLYWEGDKVMDKKTGKPLFRDGGEGEPRKKDFVVPPFNSVVTDLNRQPIDNTLNKQVATSTGIPKKVLEKKAQTQIDAKAYSNVYEENARKERLIDAEKASNTPYTSDNWQDVLARTSQATGDKLRFSDKANFFDDYINPFSMIGSMAAGVGSIPQDLQQGEYTKAALALGIPLSAGALGGIGAKSTGQFVNNMINPLVGFGSKSGDVNDVVTSLRKELSEKGIISQQKTLNLPWKEPIRKGIDPWGYDIKSKTDDIKSLFINSKNKNYLTPEKIDRVYDMYLRLRRPTEDLLSKEDYLKTINKHHLFKTKREVVDSRFADRFSDESSLSRKNRYATWDMYLGKPQTKHPMYDISSLTKSKDDVIYTIKKDFIDTKKVESRLSEYVDEIVSLEKNGKKRMTMIGADDMVKKDDSWIIPDSDSGVFGTMGGFHWKVDKLPDGNYKVLANDVWDLQPFKNSKIAGDDLLSGKILNKAIKPIKNIEVGKALGIGKPLNVKVGFIIDKDTKKIINTFGLAPAAIAAGIGVSQQDKKYGGERKLKKPSYAEGGEYEVSDKEIQRLKKLGYEFEETI